MRRALVYPLGHVFFSRASRSLFYCNPRPFISDPSVGLFFVLLQISKVHEIPTEWLLLGYWAATPQNPLGANRLPRFPESITDHHRRKSSDDRLRTNSSPCKGLVTTPFGVGQLYILNTRDFTRRGSRVKNKLLSTVHSVALIIFTAEPPEVEA